jgi:hypothetical protein
MVFESRKFGIIVGILMFIISFFYLTQTGLKGVLHIPVIDEYIEGFTMPTMISGISLVVIAWITMVLGIVFLVIAIMDLPPFNF